MSNAHFGDWWETDLSYDHGSAKVIADSVSDDGDRLTTVEGILWRPMLAELNTHRALSRNSASSRAIPLRRANRRGTLDLIEDHPAGPLYWGAEKPGMQSGDALTEDDLYNAEMAWADAREDAVASAESLAAIGLHKSICNRLIEPFMWHRVILTASSWQNMLDQRSTHRTPHAQPEMAALATSIEDLLVNSVPEPVAREGWHLPYVLPDEREGKHPSTLKKISVARCARVSYLNHDQVKDVDEDIRFHNKLLAGRPMHASPFEHVATPWVKGRGNFQGWRQYRHEVEDRANVDSLR